MENNKIIAEFMGDDYEILVFSAKEDLYNIGHRNDSYIDNNYQLYHNSWEKLMSVVEAIEQHILFEEFRIESSQVIVRGYFDCNSLLYKAVPYNCFGHKDKSKIQAVFGTLL